MLIKQIKNKCTVIFFDLCELSCREVPNQSRPPRHVLVSWLGSCFKCMSGGLSHGEMPNQGRHFLHGFEPHPGFPALPKLQYSLPAVNLPWVLLYLCEFLPQQCPQLGFHWYAGIIVPIWFLFIRGDLPLWRVTHHFFPHGGLFICNYLPPLSCGFHPGGTFFPQRWSGTAWPIAVLSFVQLFPRVRRLPTTVCIWLFLSHRYTLHQPRGVQLHKPWSVIWVWVHVVKVICWP